MNAPRILVVRLGAMGDIIQTLPAVSTLKASFEGSRISWAMDRKWRELITGNPDVHEIVEFDRRNPRSVLALRRTIRQRRFNLVLDFQGLLKSALVASFAKAPRTVGFDWSSVREKLAVMFYSDAVKPSARHVVDRYIELAHFAGATQLIKSFAIPAGQEEGLLPSGGFVLASPRAGWRSKEWPTPYWTELARLLQNEKKLPLVVNGPAEVQITGAHTHASSISGLIDATRKATAVVGVDSGPLHLAAALNKPGVAIFGPTDPERNGPYGTSIRVLRATDTHTTYKRDNAESESMRAITPEQVMAALQSKL